jgi:hypothetical protein
MTSARLWSTMYWAERSTPSVLSVDAETTNLTVAALAIAPDHSQSRSASPSSSAPWSPGSVPLTTTWGGLAGSTIDLRKVAQLLSSGCVRATTAMVLPLPSMLAV